jgi:hypothetical protein
MPTYKVRITYRTDYTSTVIAQSEEAAIEAAIEEAKAECEFGPMDLYTTIETENARELNQPRE